MSRLRFQIRWSPGIATDAMEASLGEVGVWLDNECVWGKGTPSDWIGFEWPLIELLEHLAVAWPFLSVQDRDPFGLIDPANILPSMLRTELERQWRLEPSTDEDERLLMKFELAHDLAKAFKGAWPSSLWLVRCGNKYLVESNHAISWHDAKDILDTLEQLGNDIAERITSYRDSRSITALNRWRSRRDTSKERLLQIATELDPSELREISKNSTIEKFWELDLPTPLECRELAAAARMASNCLSTSSLAIVLDNLKKCPKRETPRLDHLCEIYSSQNASRPFERPYEEGHFAATWLREQEAATLQEQERLHGSPFIDANLLLSSWNVFISRLALPERDVDAVAAWGPLHGPVVLLNINGRHVKNSNACNVTLAHEICHLIVDRKEALPVAEVLGGKVMASVEARARAFAAELLLPRMTAYDRFREQINRGFSVKKVVILLSRRYFVSKEVVAWQVRNQEAHLTDQEHRELRRYVKDRRLF